VRTLSGAFRAAILLIFSGIAIVDPLHGILVGIGLSSYVGLRLLAVFLIARRSKGDTTLDGCDDREAGAFAAICGADPS
jgi:hypothetical protein